ncbi:hypothetical protein EFP05_08830, partial [Lactiplantibacillus pentosus]|nr:hypothetical protein [Lactiplantibacillus pentosus]
GHLNVLIGIHQSRSSCLIYVIKFVQVISCNLPNQNLIDLNIRQRFGLTVIAIKHGKEINVSPKPTDMMALHDVITVVGSIKSVNALDDALKK